MRKELPKDFDPNPPTPDLTESTTFKLKKAITEPHTGLYAMVMTVTSMVCLTVILWANASDFDITEGKVIMLMAAVLGGREFIPVFIRRLTSNPEPVE